MKDDRDAAVLASDLLKRGYEHQMEGDLEGAIELYVQSLEVFPTAEGHTFLGWALSFQGHLEEAIEECKRAIELDPEYGNPYNDIGAYLIEKQQYEEAIPWLKKATRARRYDAPQFPHYNLGRVYESQGLPRRALEEFRKALELAPDYQLARDAVEKLTRKIN
jgi:tetratricopeptide (TPR) repeat protein